MNRKWFIVKQIARILKQAEAIGNVRDLCRKHSFSEQTFYRWRGKYGGIEVSEANWVKELERENAGLKKLMGELSLDNGMFKDVLVEKW